MSFVGGTHVSCLDELNEMMRCDYSGRASRYKLSHIDFNQLEIPDIKDSVRQFVIQDMLRRCAMQMGETMHMIGITPFIVVKRAVVIDGVKTTTESPTVLAHGSYDIYVDVDHKTMEPKYRVIIRNTGFDNHSEKHKVYVIRYSNCAGPSFVNGEVVDSPCGRLLPEYRRMKMQMQISDAAYHRSIQPITWIQHKPDPASERTTATDIEAMAANTVAQLVEGSHPDAEKDEFGHIHPKHGIMRYIKEFSAVIVPRDYTISSHVHTLPHELFDYSALRGLYSNIVDAEYVVTGVRAYDGSNAKHFSSSLSETMNTNMHKSLDLEVEDLKRGLRDMWKTVWPDDIDNISISLPYGRPMEIEPLVMLAEKGFVPMNRVVAQARKVARLSEDDYTVRGFRLDTAAPAVVPALPPPSQDGVIDANTRLAVAISDPVAAAC